MPKMIVEFEWNEELGSKWMNMDNLDLLLYGQEYTKRELLSATELKQPVPFLPCNDDPPIRGNFGFST